MSVALSKEYLHAEIAMRYRAAARTKHDTRAPLTMTTLRTRELERIFRYRFGGRFPDTPEGRDALAVMAEHHVMRNDLETVARWIVARAPWVAERAAGMAERAAGMARRQKAGALGWRIRLTRPERDRLRIKTIRAIGMTDEGMANERLHRARCRKEDCRRQAGATPRPEYEANSKAQQKPWLAVGMSRSSWYRAGQPKPRGTGPSAIKKVEIPIAATPVPALKTVKVKGTSPLGPLDVRLKAHVLESFPALGFRGDPSECRLPAV